MSWLRSAVNRAVEAGEKTTNITRTVRSYADSVVVHAGNAVAEGAKIIQHRIGAGNSKSFRLTVKRLEEVSVSCRGIERVQLLRRWLVALKEIQRLSSFSAANSVIIEKIEKNNCDDRLIIISDEAKDSPRKPTMDYYVDPDLGTMNFHDLFLYSQALEGITLSMILEAPNEEEVSLLLEIFGLCLAGGKEIHKAVMSSIQDLASTFSSYEDEVLIKREELLQYAQGAIAGLKINADISRIDAEACSLVEKLDKMKAFHQSPNDDRQQSSEVTTSAMTKAFEDTVGQIELCSTLEALLLKKKSLSNGDTPKIHAEKVDKLKVLSESLLNSTSKAERRILDHRSQKEEALHFRVTKSSEVSQLEKDLAVEIRELEKQKEDLAAELKKVSNSLNVTRARLHNAREEREQFDDASNQILVHLKNKEDELSKSISSCRVEADVVNTWINFLEDTWALRTKFNQEKEKQVNVELERYQDHFMNLVIHLLTSYKEELEPSITRIRGLVADLKAFQGSEKPPSAKAEDPKERSQRKNLEKEYLNLEVKFLTFLSMINGVKEQYHNGKKGTSRKDNETVENLFDALEKLRIEFESMERPVLEVDTPIQRSHSLSSSPDSPSDSSKPESDIPQIKTETSEGNGEKAQSQVQLEQFEPDDTDYLPEEIGEWVFDELEKELKASS
ncbi:intracellular protein transport protein USO1 [Mercurialis annua]|uniref:intracellular protein transport protein USO1 n=1 Tax=Mercurialis annua TaxID=3986 RepID=UPI002160C51F|nr:intracellular protein transport protein USO1 [Mercurialis annua]